MVYYLIGNLIWIHYVGWYIWWSCDWKNLPNRLLWQEWPEYTCHETWMSGLMPPLFHLSMRTYSLYHTMLSNSVIQICCFVFQNTKNANGQVKYLVYCMENAILNLPHGQDQMVWLIDFAGFNLGNLSIHVTKLTADVLQGHYLERLGVPVLYIHSPHIDSSKRLLSRVWIFILILEQGLLIYLIIMLS